MNKHPDQNTINQKKIAKNNAHAILRAKQSSEQLKLRLKIHKKTAVLRQKRIMKEMHGNLTLSYCLSQL